MHYCFGVDERFIAGTLGGGGVAYAGGCSGQMFKFGAVLGERLAAAVTDALTGAALAAWARCRLPGWAEWLCAVWFGWRVGERGCGPGLEGRGGLVCGVGGDVVAGAGFEPATFRL
ncbi:MAG: hypothetical protein WAS21_31455, partial [Geminicoccaceae bacterium]